MNNKFRTIALLGLLAAGSLAFAETARLEAGKEVYEAHCAKCHDTGMMGAPMTGSSEDWKDRSKKQWEAVLAEHTESGFVRGGAGETGSLDVEGAVEYMHTRSNPDGASD